MMTSQTSFKLLVNLCSATCIMMIPLQGSCSIVSADAVRMLHAKASVGWASCLRYQVMNFLVIGCYGTGNRPDTSSDHVRHTRSLHRRHAAVDSQKGTRRELTHMSYFFFVALVVLTPTRRPAWLCKFPHSAMARLMFSRSFWLLLRSYSLKTAAAPKFDKSLGDLVMTRSAYSTQTYLHIMLQLCACPACRKQLQSATCIGQAAPRN